MTAPPNPAMVREIQSRIAQGWTVEVAGVVVLCRAADGGVVSINCGTVEDAEAMVVAAKA